MAKNILLGILMLSALLMGTLLVAAFVMQPAQNNTHPLKVIDEEDAFEDDEVGEVEDAYEEPITGSALDQVSAVALAYIGEGQVTDSEVGDEDDVHLDQDFKVISTEYD